MFIGLHTPDKCAYPNLALMKISAYHKSQGNKVGWYHPLFGADKVYSSQVFSFSENDAYLPEDTEIGGTGTDIKKRLPSEIENLSPDYSIYPECNFTVQRFSIGCIRNCGFCIVADKDGGVGIKSVAPMDRNEKGQWVDVLDNNFFGHDGWGDSVEWLLSNGQPVAIQGVDIRILNIDHIEALNKMKHHKQIKIAWDDPSFDMTPYFKNIVRMIKPYKLMCYILIGYNSTQKDDLRRVQTVSSFGIDPFVMPYNKEDRYQRSFARWVNHKAVYKTVAWDDYKK